MEVRVVCQMTANRGVIAKHFILDGSFARPDRIEKIRLVRRNVAVSGRRRKDLGLHRRLVFEGRGLGIFRCPLREICITKPRGPTLGRICLGLGSNILRRERQRLIQNLHRSLRPLEFDRFAALITVVQIAVQ